MSINLVSGAARTLFDDVAQAEYASAGPDLRPFVTYRPTSGADTFTFRKYGRVTAKTRVTSQSELENADLTHTKIQVSLTNVYASDVTDIFDQDCTNAPQEIPALAKVLAQAVKRDETQRVINALVNAGSYAATITAASSGMTIAKLVNGLKALRKNDIGETPILLYTENQEADVLQLTQFTSADYARVSGDPSAMTGEVRDGHYGVARYMRIGSGRDETGLPVASSTRDCFLFVPSAVGLAVGFGGSVQTTVIRSEHEWWRSTVKTRVGAVALNTNGIVKIQCTES